MQLKACLVTKVFESSPKSSLKGKKKKGISKTAARKRVKMCVKSFNNSSRNSRQYFNHLRCSKPTTITINTPAAINTLTVIANISALNTSTCPITTKTNSSITKILQQQCTSWQPHYLQPHNLHYLNKLLKIHLLGGSHLITHGIIISQQSTSPYEYNI